VATIVNFHGDYSSQKVVIGQYLAGRVTAVIGDHWHIPTADAQVLPGGTAHITDVGMVGALDSSLGVVTDIIAQRWLHPDERRRNEMEEGGRKQFNAVLIDVDTATGLARSIEQIRQILPA
jgi:calcineurin-like phosphoesterase